MDKKDIACCLCIRDSRNPYYDEDSLPLRPGDKCFCDSCHRGTTPLANRILELESDVDKANLVRGLEDVRVRYYTCLACGAILPSTKKEVENEGGIDCENCGEFITASLLDK